MDMSEIISFLLIGIVAGWIAGKLMKGRGFGLVGNMVVGVLGAAAGSVLFGLVGLRNDGSLIGVLITAVVGAVVLLFVIGVLRKA